MIMYAQALQPGIAKAEQILRRFTTCGPQALHSGCDRGTQAGPRCTARSTKGCKWWNSTNMAIHYGREPSFPPGS
jgi:hypothetical protein